MPGDLLVPSHLSTPAPQGRGGVYRVGSPRSSVLFSLQQKLGDEFASPVDFLKHLKDPVGRTRSAVRAADYLETTLKLLKRKLKQSGRMRFNITGNVL